MRATPIVDSVLCPHPGGWHRMAYRRWQASATPLAEVVCLHGFNRSGADFRRLAQDLAQLGCNVTAPDLVGRGESDWLIPLHYHPLQYALDVQQLLRRVVGVRRRASLAPDLCRRIEAFQARYLPLPDPITSYVCGGVRGWQADRPPLVVIGTSLGGLLGMMLAGRIGSPVDYLVLNDVGPEIPAPFIEALRSFARERPRVYENEEAVRRLAREYGVELGALSEGQWQEYLEAVLIREEEGYRERNDRGIYAAVRPPLPAMDVNLWPLWAHVACPTLVLRGELSQVLTRETAQRMAAKAQVVELIGVGHAPTLLPRQERAIITDWLRGELAQRRPRSHRTGGESTALWSN